jgi:uncharacterized membrane protein
MNTVLLILLIEAVFLLFIGLSFYFGYRLGTKRKKPIETNEEEQRKAKKIHEHFSNLFNYDVTTALQRKKVTDE